MPDVLSDLFNACEPLVPASPAQYVDTNAARGGGAFISHFIRQLALARGSRTVQCLISGHNGCGKSTELKRLEHELRKGAIGPCCFPVYIDSSEFLDDFDVAPSDILLAIAAATASELRDRHGVDLSDSYIIKRLDELRRLFLTDVDLDKIDTSSGGIKATWQLLKKNPGGRQRVREALQPELSSLIEGLNSFLSSARQRIAKIRAGGAPYTDIVLILDSLERLQRVADKAEGTLSQRELFIEKSAQLTGIRAHTIFTVPLSLCRSSGMLLAQIYGEAPFVLPMVKVFERGTRTRYSPGREAMKEILRRRIPGSSLEDAFEADALDWALDYSGGSVRVLMTLAEQSATYVDRPPITLEAVQRAMKPLISQFASCIPNSYWPKLAALEASTDQHVDNSDPDFQSMLEQLIAMEYVNGSDSDDLFADAAPWYAVNPIVRELRQFRAAVLAHA